MKITRRQFQRSRTASVLPLAVVVVVVLLIIGLALIRLGLSARMQAARTAAEISARAAADAGLVQAKRLMDQKWAARLFSEIPISPVSDVALPNAYSSFSYTVSDKGSDGCYIVTSVGKSGDFAERTVKGKLKAESSWHGIGVKETIDIKVGVTFSTDPPDADFTIRTNSTKDSAIELKSGTVIPGDIIVGPGGDPEDVVKTPGLGATTGDMYAAQNEIDFPPVVLPDELAGLPTTTYTYNPSVPIGDPTSVVTQYFRLDTLQIPGGAGDYVQEIQGPCVIYIEDKTILGQGASLVVTNGASLILYLGGDMEAKNSVGIDNENSNPAALKIYGLDSCGQIDLKAKGNIFFGYVYAPNADLDVYAKNELAGAFTGKSFNLKNATNFTFIPPPGASGIENPESYLMQRWWEE